MVPPTSHGIPRAPRYSGSCFAASFFAYTTLTFFGVPSHALLLNSALSMQSLTPYVFLHMVWPLSRSLATTCEISLDFSSSPYLDVSVQAVPPVYLFIQYTVLWY